MLERNVIYYGSNLNLPEVIPLRAGLLTMYYVGGNLRYIRYRDSEILRNIYIALRDHNWDTIRNDISQEKFKIEKDSFNIKYNVVNRQDNIHFTWQANINGTKEGGLNLSFEGEVISSFKHNRTGFCLLHPIKESAGKTFKVTQPEGVVKEGVLPIYIISEQPIPSFTDMISMEYELQPGVQVKLEFKGDLFEMEDQRAWTDSSYKTYCTPQYLPIPQELQAGTKINQSVSLSLITSEPTALETSMSSDQGVSIQIHEESSKPLPEIGLGTASHSKPLTNEEIARLKKLDLSHLRLDLVPANPDSSILLRQATDEARAIDSELEIALFLNDAEKELQKLTSELEEINPPICRWLIFGPGRIKTDGSIAALARQYLKKLYPDTDIGGGSNANFWELDHFRPPLDELDLVCFSMNPQVHTYDNDSLVESLECEALTVNSAKQFVGNLPLVVSPITLKMRFNPYAIEEGALGPGQLPPQVDVRQMSLFGAGWTVGSLNSLAGSGPQSLTYFETTGWRGVMETESGSSLPDQFPSLPGSVFPVYHIFRQVGEFSGGDVLETTTTDPLQVVAIALRKNGRNRNIVANLTPNKQHVNIHGISQAIEVSIFDETNVEESMRDPSSLYEKSGRLLESTNQIFNLELLPYAIARLDSVTKQ